MAVERALPYLGCHFQVRWSPGEQPPEGSGFSEVVLPALTADAFRPGDADATSGGSAIGAVAPGAAMGINPVAAAGGIGEALAEHSFGSEAALRAVGGEGAVGASSGSGPEAAGEIGLAIPPPLVLRRGFLGSLELYTWWRDTRLGTDKRVRTLVVDLLDDEHGKVVCTWEFADARPVQLDYSPLQALGASVLIETLTLTYASMTMK